MSARGASHAGRSPAAPSLAAAVVTLAVALTLASCDDGTTRDGIERATFVATYVDLRRAMTRDGELPPAVRDSILAAHDVTMDELRAYVQGRTGDPGALSDTWREIMDSLVVEDDTLSAVTDSI